MIAGIGLIGLFALIFAATFLSRRGATAFIRLYRALAPGRVRAACRFEPTCSEYAILAIGRWGAPLGWRLTGMRLLRCRPPNGGADWPPVRE